MPERRLVKERSRSSKARCGTAALAIFPFEGKSCCCQCGGSCVSEGVDAKVSFVRKSELQSLGLSVRIRLIAVLSSKNADGCKVRIAVIGTKRSEGPVPALRVVLQPLPFPIQL